LIQLIPEVIMNQILAIVLIVTMAMLDVEAKALQRSQQVSHAVFGERLASLFDIWPGMHHHKRREGPIVFEEENVPVAEDSRLQQDQAEAAEKDLLKGSNAQPRTIPSASQGRIVGGVHFNDEVKGHHLGPATRSKLVNWLPKIDRSRCTSEGYCEVDNDDEEYPAEAILEKLASQNSLNVLMSYFGAEPESEDDGSATSNSVERPVVNAVVQLRTSVPKAQAQNDVSFRLNTAGMLGHVSSSDMFPDGQPLCDSTEMIHFPRKALNKKNQEMWIVNVKNYTQGVNVVKCRNANGSCGELASSFPSGSRSYCRQKYVSRHLVAINSEDGNHVVDSFAMPSCCVCYVKSGRADTLFGRMSQPMRRVMTPAKIGALKRR